MVSLRRLFRAALIVGTAGPLAAQPTVTLPRQMSSSEPPASVVPPPPSSVPSAAPAMIEGSPAPSCEPCPPKACGPIMKHVPKVLCPPKVYCPPAPVYPTPAPACSTGCTTPVGPGYGAAPARPAYGAAPATAMTTIQVPYTYMVPVPTFAMVPHTTYGAAPVAYGTAPVTYGAAPVAYGAPPMIAPPAYGYGAAPVMYGAPPAVAPAPVYAAPPPVPVRPPTYGAAPDPADCCKKEIPDLKKQVEELDARTRNTLVGTVEKFKDLESNLNKTLGEKIMDNPKSVDERLKALEALPKQGTKKVK